MPPTPAPPAVQRWTPWAIGVVVAVVYVALGPRAGASDAPVWSVLARVASMLPIGDLADRAQLLGAVCAGAAAVIIARLAIELGGGDAAAIAGAVAAAAVMVGAGPWAHAATAGPIALISVLVLAAIALADRVAGGGGAWPGIAACVVLGLAGAMDRAALAVVPVLGALLVIRLRHGARWPLIAPIGGAVAWALAMIPVWRAGAQASVGGVGDARYAIELADAVGAIAAVAGLAGVAALLARRSTRWAGALVVALIAGGIALDRLAGHPVGALPVVGLALAAGAGVGRMARLVAPPIGQACVGAAAAVIVALPAALAG